MLHACCEAEIHSRATIYSADGTKILLGILGTCRLLARYEINGDAVASATIVIAHRSTVARDLPHCFRGEKLMARQSPSQQTPDFRKTELSIGLGFVLTAALSVALLAPCAGYAAQPQSTQPPPPCHPNPRAAADTQSVLNRGDIRHLPQPLRDRLAEQSGRPHSQLPTQTYAEADQPSQLFQYYLLDTNGFEPNPFTSLFPGINDTAMLTATGPDCGLPTIGSVRVVLEPKPDLPTDPNDVRAFIDVFTDVSGLFVINNESGWYEGWMIHDLIVAPINDTPRGDGHAQFGTILKADAYLLKAKGAGNNVPGKTFTMDGNTPHLPSASDHFPNAQTNVVPLQLSMGAWNTLQQSDGHAYWEFNYTTNWIHPLYELPFTGGIPGTFEAG